MDWLALIHNVVEGAAGMALGMRLSQWLEMPQGDAIDEIHAFVFNSSVEAIDTMDCIFIHVASIQIMPVTKVQLLKCYAYFKIAEQVRFGKFRGFPPYPTS